MYPLAAYHGPVDTATSDTNIADERRQIGLASAGKVLASSAGGESHRNWTYTAPVDEATAEALVAYWLAVGARVGYPSLLSAARGFYSRADGRIKALSSGDVSGIRNVIDEGVRALDGASAFKDRRMAGVYRGLGQNRRAEEIERAQALAYQQSNAYIIAGTAKDTAKDIAAGLEKAGRIITNKTPPGTPDWLWWLQRNVWLMLGVGAAGIAAWIFLKPVLAPILGVRDAAAAASRRASDKAITSLGSVARNPRRRRRFHRRSR
jgi:hypothetical protein